MPSWNEILGQVKAVHKPSAPQQLAEGLDPTTLASMTGSPGVIPGPQQTVPTMVPPNPILEMEAQVPFDRPDPTAAANMDQGSFVAQKHHTEAHQHIQRAMASLAAARQAVSDTTPQSKQHAMHLDDLSHALGLASQHLQHAVSHVGRANVACSE